ncbi:MAG: helix-turn-helix domain-containing protein [Polyangiaceae bacterium]
MNESSPLHRRDRILAAAEKLFHHYGQKKTTMADIAREAGIGVGSVYLDFPSKEALLQELAAQRTEIVVRAMRVAAEGARSPGGRVEAMLVARVEALLDEAERGTHACDLISCSPRDAPGPERPGAPNRRASDGCGAHVFGVEIRALVSSELDRWEIAIADRDGTLDAIELAFGALSPPWLFKFPRDRALELARRLSALVVRGLQKG